MDKNGFLSQEGLLSLILMISLISALPTQAQSGTQELLLSEKLSDLLIVWARGNYTKEEMEGDANSFLGKGNFEILQKNGKSEIPPGERVIAKEIAVYRNDESGKIKLIYFKH